MKNEQSKALNIVSRLIAVAATISLCLLLSTTSRLPQVVTAEAQEGEVSPTVTATPTPTPEPTPEYFKLSFVGDCTLASTTANKPLGISYEKTVGDNYAYPFEKTVQYFSDDDFTFANLECALTTSTSSDTKNFCFRADPSYTQILTSGSVEFVTLGNNHVLDYGDQGYADTKAALDAAVIGYAGRDEGKIYETASGLKIGVYAVSFGNTQQIKQGVAALKAAGAEFIVAAIHWGDEGSYDVNDLQKEQGHAAIDAGADLVYGSHPHTLQPCEEYNGKYIYYSMGNWSFGGNTAPRDPDTIILKLTVKRDIDGTISIDNREVIPCACTGVVGGNNYPPVPYEAGSEQYTRTLSKIDGTFDGPNLTIGYQYNFSEY